MKYIALSLIFFAQSALANSWVSSGGDLFRDANNPWWIQNKTQIIYCVAFDQATISANHAQAESVVKKVFENWLAEWKIFFQSKRGEPFSLGTQTLVKQECVGSEDISFRFGWGSLTQSQKTFLLKSHNPSSLVGIAVRTGYDFQNLSGKGFIYIASDIGKNRFDARDDLYENPWRHTFLLSTLLAHEIGHTFGLKHSDQFDGLMAEDFFELILNKEFVNLIKDRLGQTWDFHFFSRARRFEADLSNAHASSDVLQLLGVGASAKVSLQPSGDMSGSYELYSRESTGEMLVQKMKFNSSTIKYGENNGSVSIYLNQDQKVVANPANKEKRLYIYTDGSIVKDGFMENQFTGARKAILLMGNGGKLTLRHYDGLKHLEVNFESSLIDFPSTFRSLKNRKVTHDQGAHQ